MLGATTNYVLQNTHESPESCRMHSGLEGICTQKIRPLYTGNVVHVVRTFLRPVRYIMHTHCKVFYVDYYLNPSFGLFTKATMFP